MARNFSLPDVPGTPPVPWIFPKFTFFIPPSPSNDSSSDLPLVARLHERKLLKLGGPSELAIPRILTVASEGMFLAKALKSSSPPSLPPTKSSLLTWNKKRLPLGTAELSSSQPSDIEGVCSGVKIVR